MGFSRRNGFGVAVGAVGGLAAILMAVVTPASGATVASTAPIHAARNNGPVTLHNGDTKLVTLQLPAGHWLITAKVWADSVPGQSTTTTVVGCHLGKGGTSLDNTAFNIPKVGGAGGSSAGVNVDIASVTLHSRATISFQCNDFGSQAVAHEAVISAVG
jgi:hypothetical protein